MRSFALISTLFMIGASAVFYGCAKEKAREPGTAVKVVKLCDTICSQDCLEQFLIMTHYSDGKNPPKVYVSVDSWFAGGGHFVGFKKTMNGIVQLGWINVEVISYDAIRLKAYAITERNAAVNELIIACGK
jgi:hypothetical protein